MSREGDRWDNGVAGSSSSTLVHELPAHTVLPSRNEAIVTLTIFIELWYNKEQWHPTLDYVSPQQSRGQFHQMARAA